MKRRKITERVRERERENGLLKNKKKERKALLFASVCVSVWQRGN